VKREASPPPGEGRKNDALAASNYYLKPRPRTQTKIKIKRVKRKNVCGCGEEKCKLNKNTMLKIFTKEIQ